MRHRDDPDSVGQGAPLVGRPSGAAWRALQADGILWEGQVLLIGVDVDLAARLIVTEHRLAFARGGAVVLDIPRAWLQPAPALRRDDSVLLSITADGNPEPERILLRMRDGHPATNYLLDLLVGPGRAAPALPSQAGPQPSGGARLLPPLPEPARPAPSFPRPRPTGDPALTRPLPVSPRDPFGTLPPAAAAP